MRDLASNIAVAKAFGPVTLAADQTAVEIDLQGFSGAVIMLDVGIGGITFDASNRIEITIRHKANSGDAYGNVAVADFNGKDAPTSITSNIVKSFIAAHAAAAHYEIGYIGGKRYLEIDIEFVGTHGTGTPMCINVLKGFPNVGPAN